MDEETVKILVAAAAVFVSCLAAFAAVLQWTTARQKLALELFDRRIAYYNRVRALIIEVAGSGTLSHRTLLDFARDTDDARFFFGHDVRQLLDRLYFHTLEATSLREQLYPDRGGDGLPVGDARAEVSQRFSDEMKWLSDQLQEAPVIFAPYLYLGAATVPTWPGFRVSERRSVRRSWEVAKAEVARRRSAPLKPRR